nr:YkgJ family cysteine cluster protein [uncultured Desulfuromonas sp.]
MAALFQLLDSYQSLLAQVDQWFDDAASSLGPSLGCHIGCSDCCRGLFDITLPDALLLQMGFSTLETSRREQVLERCRARLKQLQQQWPELAAPYLLNHLQQRPWQTMPEHDATPCPLLNDQGECLVYAWRPLTCRLHGLPHVDVDGDVFSDGCCPYNEEAVCQSVGGVQRGPFRDFFTQEAQLIRQVNQALVGRDVCELDTFIPLALLIDFSDPQLWSQPLDIATL